MVVPPRSRAYARYNRLDPGFSCRTTSIRQQGVQVAPLPTLRLIVVLVHRFVGEELLGVELPAAVLHADVVDLMQHLVEHDPRNEEPRHERAIERAMDADQ